MTLEGILTLEDLLILEELLMLEVAPNFVGLQTNEPSGLYANGESLY